MGGYSAQVFNNQRRRGFNSRRPQQGKMMTESVNWIAMALRELHPHSDELITELESLALRAEQGRESIENEHAQMWAERNGWQVRTEQAEAREAALREALGSIRTIAACAIATNSRAVGDWVDDVNRIAEKAIAWRT
jgi:hypothetical protein